jgi:hypothetical protein
LLHNDRALVVAALTQHVATDRTSDSANGCGGAVNAASLGNWWARDWVLDTWDTWHTWDRPTASEAEGEGDGYND